jgi:hypothetical protein
MLMFLYSIDAEVNNTGGVNIGKNQGKGFGPFGSKNSNNGATRDGTSKNSQKHFMLWCS